RSVAVAAALVGRGEGRQRQFLLLDREVAVAILDDRRERRDSADLLVGREIAVSVLPDNGSRGDGRDRKSFRQFEVRNILEVSRERNYLIAFRIGRTFIQRNEPQEILHV